jgi:hypothetical protein
MMPPQVYAKRQGLVTADIPIAQGLGVPFDILVSLPAMDAIVT